MTDSASCFLDTEPEDPEPAPVLPEEVKRTFLTVNSFFFFMLAL